MKAIKYLERFPKGRRVHHYSDQRMQHAFEDSYHLLDDLCPFLLLHALLKLTLMLNNKPTTSFYSYYITDVSNS